MKEQSWQQFMQTGEIQAYLNYKKETELKAEDIQEDDVEMNMHNQEN